MQICRVKNSGFPRLAKIEVSWLLKTLGDHVAASTKCWYHCFLNGEAGLVAAGNKRITGRSQYRPLNTLCIGGTIPTPQHQNKDDDFFHKQRFIVYLIECQLIFFLQSF